MEKKHNNKVHPGLLLSSFIILGMGIGMFADKIEAGILLGFGAGFLAMLWMQYQK